MTSTKVIFLLALIFIVLLHFVPLTIDNLFKEYIVSNLGYSMTHFEITI